MIGPVAPPGLFIPGEIYFAAVDYKGIVSFAGRFGHGVMANYFPSNPMRVEITKDQHALILQGGTYSLVQGVLSKVVVPVPDVQLETVKASAKSEVYSRGYKRLTIAINCTPLRALVSSERLLQARELLTAYPTDTSFVPASVERWPLVDSHLQSHPLNTGWAKATAIVAEHKSMMDDHAAIEKEMGLVIVAIDAAMSPAEVATALSALKP